MEVFNTVVSAIAVAERVWKLIDDYRKAPERLRRLQVDLKILQSVLERLKAMDFLGNDQRLALEPDIVEIEQILQKILHDKRKASLTLALNAVNLNMIASIDATNRTAISLIQSGMTSTTDASDLHDAGSISARQFLDYLNPPNYVDDKFQIKEPAEGTASWIYDSPGYTQWRETSEPLAILHVVGKMGSGKSVLMKSIVKNLQAQTGEPARPESAVLYYFCTCVNRTDTSITILRGFIAQLINHSRGLFEKAIPDIEILQVQRLNASSNWSLGALWHVFITLIRHGSFPTLYCVIDALDECEPMGLEELLQRLFTLSNVRSSPVNTHPTKLLFSSRERSDILTLLDVGRTRFRLFIRPSSVTSDIRIAMQSDFYKLKTLLHLDNEEAEKMQETLITKADGMFLWVMLAMKDIMSNCYHATHEDLEELINDLPFELKGLYEKSWAKVLRSLPTEQVALAKRVLNWILLARRPLTVSELTVALAVNPSDKNVPHRNKLFRSLSDFILRFLVPFVEIFERDMAKQHSVNGEEGAWTLPTGPTVRLVHQSAQEYLLSVCKRGADGQKLTLSGPSIDIRDGHETMALICMSYLQCKELQLGWVGLGNRHPDGGQIVTDEDRKEVQKRQESHPLLNYAAQNWAYHVRQAQYVSAADCHSEGCVIGKIDDDVFQRALDLLQKYRSGYECATQVQQLMGAWDYDVHYGPGPPLSAAVAAHISILVRHLLDDPATDIYERDKAYGDLPLHYAATVAAPTTHPEEHTIIIDMLLEKGADVNCLNDFGSTPLHFACDFPLPEVAKILLERGANTSIKNKQGRTPLNQEYALKSYEIVEMLIQAGADLEILDNNGYSPLIKAAYLGSWETVKLLLRHGLDPKSSSADGLTCLHAAASSEETSMIKQLLDAGVPVDTETQKGYTPLHVSAENNQFEATQLLLAHGANPAITTNDGILPLHFAAEYASPKLLELLLTYQTDVDPSEAYLKPPICQSVKILLYHGADINSVNDSGDTALTSAAVHGKLETVRFLVENNVPVNGSSNMGSWNPLHGAAFYGETEVVDFLLQHGASIDRLGGPCGLTPLELSAMGGHLETLKVLVTHAARLSCRNVTLNGALPPACYNGHAEIVRWLIDIGADAKVAEIQTMIIANASPSHAEITNILLDNGVPIDEPGWTGITALFACVRWERLDILEVLLERGADLNAADSTGDTPLAVALVLKRTAVAKFLLNRGANPVLSRGTEISAAFIAARTGNIDILSYLHDNMGLRLWDQRSSGGQTLADVAVKYGRMEAFRYLLSVSCCLTAPGLMDPEVLFNIITGDHDGTVFQLLHDTGNFDFDIGKIASPFPFFYEICKRRVTEHGQVAFVKLLLGKCSEAGAKSWVGQMLLLCAAVHGCHAVIKLLLEKGIDTELAIDGSGRTPLSCATINGWPDAVRLLLDGGADIETKDRYGRTPLTWATLGGWDAVVKLLLDKGANIETKDKSGRTPLSHAAEYGEHTVATLLLAKSNAPQRLGDNIGRTPLFYAARAGNATLARVLLSGDYCDNPDLEDHYGCTSLSIAVRHCHTTVVEILLATGHVSLESKDCFGRSPLCWARRRGYTGIEQLLLDYAETKSLLMCENNPSAYFSPGTGVKKCRWCDVCTLDIPENNSFFSCGICNGADFDICLDCYAGGARCLEEPHILTEQPVKKVV
ncbi:conserved hypothetical protein [Uncinocarpus reesii 1704]|uniref:Nephrocystin 3-like N-terminal domain-containing protein n=1 Tax=Uncinocarpus reesii (strain UAMH 1704) TaxID=336963 RepID=C4JNX7_UNCRE|nr:uncharacterized protein UREG_04447 [Uncinocarpus reesii 1704]EEP79601.1 conserved hypothetical protein [Uncinocarpus reesii 1704]